MSLSALMLMAYLLCIHQWTSEGKTKPILPPLTNHESCEIHQSGIMVKIDAKTTRSDPETGLEPVNIVI